MRLRQKISGSTRQIVLLLNINFNYRDINFNYRAREIFGDLKAGHRYDFLKFKEMFKNQDKTSYSDIVDYVTNIVKNELKSQYQECIDVPIEQVKVLKTYEGSINVIFSVIFDALGLVSGLKDLYDCVQLVKVISDAHIKKRLEDQYGDLFDTNISLIIPDRYSLDHIGNKCEALLFALNSGKNVFFYYLLISNIVFLILLGLLVFKAVWTMYW